MSFWSHEFHRYQEAENKEKALHKEISDTVKRIKINRKKPSSVLYNPKDPLKNTAPSVFQNLFIEYAEVVNHIARYGHHEGELEKHLKKWHKDYQENGRRSFEKNHRNEQERLYFQKAFRDGVCGKLPKKLLSGLIRGLSTITNGQSLYMYMKANSVYYHDLYDDVRTVPKLAILSQVIKYKPDSLMEHKDNLAMLKTIIEDHLPLIPTQSWGASYYDAKTGYTEYGTIHMPSSSKDERRNYVSHNEILLDALNLIGAGVEDII